MEVCVYVYIHLTDLSWSMPGSRFTFISRGCNKYKLGNSDVCLGEAVIFGEKPECLLRGDFLGSYSEQVKERALLSLLQ